MIKNKKLFYSSIFIFFFIFLNEKSISKDFFEIEAKEVRYENKNSLIIAEGQARAINQSGKKISANKILYYKKDNLIKTEGNSKYTDNLNILQSDKLTYDTITKKFNAKGNVIFTDEKKNKFYFDSFVFNESSQIGEGVNIKLEAADGSYLQSKKGYFDKNKNIIKLYNGQFTTCINLHNKKNEFCPTWSLNSGKIIHDKNKKRIIHKNALFKLKKIPVFYTPYVSHPDPSIKRQSGFLPPLIKTLSSVGRTIQLPYFWAISNDKDITITPIYYFNEHSLIKTSYRQALKNGVLNIENGYSKGYKKFNKLNRTKGSRNYFFSDLYLNEKDIIFQNNEINFKLQRISQENFVRINKINTKLFKENIRTLENSLKISTYDNFKRLEIKTGIFENLEINNSSKYTYYLPDGLFSLNSNRINNFNTNFNSYFQTRKFLNNQKQTKIRNILDLESKKLIFKNYGLSNTFRTTIYNNNLYNDNVEGLEKNSNIDNYLTFAFDSSFPLAKFSKGSYHMIKPRTFFKHTSGKMQNASSNEKYLNYSDIYSINRTNNLDMPEVGNSLGYGLDYSFNKNDQATGATLHKTSFGVGQILRKKQEENMPKTSSLNNKSSDFAGYLKYDFSGKMNQLNIKNDNKLYFLNYFKQNKISINYNFNIENSLEEFNRQSLNFSGTYGKLYSSLKFDQKKNHVGSDENIILNFKTLIKGNYYFNLETKKNFVTNNSEYHNISLNYENDCLQATLALNRDFYSDKDVGASKSLILSIIIKPFSNDFSPDLTSFID